MTTQTESTAPRQMPAQPQWLRVDLKEKPEHIDRDKGIIRGAILAEEGRFNDDRGEFDRQAIRRVVSLAKERGGGLKSRWGHPSASSDSLGKFLGRFHNPRADTVLREIGKDADGKSLMKERLIARADLHFDSTALEEPVGGGKPLGIYLMDLASSDGDAFGASLVLQREENWRVDKQNRRLTDEQGVELPPLWMPTALHACDCVDDPAATHSFLSADILAGLPDAIVRQGCEMLDTQFKDQTRDVIKARLSAFVDRYLSHRFGSQEAIDAIVNASAPDDVEESMAKALNAADTDKEEPKPAPVVSDDWIVLDLWLATEE